MNTIQESGDPGVFLLDLPKRPVRLDVLPARYHARAEQSSVAVVVRDGTAREAFLDAGSTSHSVCRAAP